MKELTVYKTVDGKTFDDKGKAKGHEAGLNRKRDFNKVRDNLKQVLHRERVQGATLNEEVILDSIAKYLTYKDEKVLSISVEQAKDKRKVQEKIQLFLDRWS